MLLFIGAVGLALFYLMPAWNMFSQLRNDTAALYALSADIDSLTATRDRLADQINAVSKEDLDRLEQMIPEGAHGPEFLMVIQALASRNRLTINLLNWDSTIITKSKSGANVAPGFTVPVESEKAKQVKELLINGSFSGSYLSFKQFLIDLESLVRITDVQNITLSPGTEQKNDFGYALQIKIYYQ